MPTFRTGNQLYFVRRFRRAIRIASNPSLYDIMRVKEKKDAKTISISFKRTTTPGVSLAIEAGFFKTCLHIDRLGYCDGSSLNSKNFQSIFRKYSPPKDIVNILVGGTDYGKYAQGQEQLVWNKIVFAGQIPDDRALKYGFNVRSKHEAIKRYLALIDKTCKYYNGNILIKLHPKLQRPKANYESYVTEIKSIAKRHGSPCGFFDFSCIKNCQHIITGNSTFTIEALTRGLNVINLLPGYFYKTGAVTFSNEDYKKAPINLREEGLKLVNFLAWKYCFPTENFLYCLHYLNNKELFFLPEKFSFAAKLILENNND